MVPSSGPSSTSPPSHPHSLPTPAPLPSLGPSHALCPPLLPLTSPAGNTASGFPSDLQVPVNKVLQRRCHLFRSHLPTPTPQSSSQGEAGFGQRSEKGPRAQRLGFTLCFSSTRVYGVFSLDRKRSPSSGLGSPMKGWSRKTSLHLCSRAPHGHPRPGSGDHPGWPRVFS